MGWVGVEEPVWVMGGGVSFLGGEWAVFWSILAFGLGCPFFFASSSVYAGLSGEREGGDMFPLAVC